MSETKHESELSFETVLDNLTRDAEEQPGEENSGEKTLAIPALLPVLPVRDVVIFNYMILPLFIGRDKSVQAVNAALQAGRHILICTQRDETVEDPTEADLYPIGTVAQIMRMLKMPDGRVKLLIQGVTRARVLGFERSIPYFEARVESLTEKEAPSDATTEALLRAVREQSEKVLSLRGIASSDVVSVLQGVDDPGRLADLIAANIRMKPADAQRILEEDDPIRRLELVNAHLQREVEVATVQARIQTSAREGMEKAQKDYFLREQLKAIRHELGETGGEEDDMDELRQSLKRAGLPRDVQKEADKQLRRLAGMHADSSEANVVRTYLDWLAPCPAASFRP